ncbi:MAG: hypothetical protein K8S87_00075 [Planctomycetes bacterium]|nr:hypothetical protein [Planctomycetota bacterium]
MFIYPFFADAQTFSEEFTALKHAFNVSYFSVFAIVLLFAISLVVNHIKLKKLFTNSLAPFLILFTLHPAWTLRILKLEKPSTLETTSYVFFGLAVLWFIVILIITKKPAETPAKSEPHQSN